MRKIKKDQQKNLLTGLGVVIVVVLLIFVLPNLRESAPEELVVEREPVVREEGISVKEETSYTFGEEFTSNFECVDGEGMRFTLTNIWDSSFNVADTLFLLNTAPDTTPECGKVVLQPGESTECTLDVVPLGFSTSVVVKTPFDREVKKVSC